MRRLIFVFSMLSILIFTHCTSNKGDKFIGTWYTDKFFPYERFKISQNGESFILEPINCNSLTNNINGIYTLTKEGNLIKSGGSTTIALIEKDDQLLICDVRYNREKEVKISSDNTFKDPRDGHVYHTLTVGTQTWLAENLAYKYNGGCWAYNNDQKYVDLYGYLYDWSSAPEACPKGWHIPSVDEWTTLFNNLGGTAVAGGKLKAKINWASPNTGATDSIGFSALPGGMRYHGGDFGSREGYGYWWSSTENSNEDVWAIELYYNEAVASSSNHYKINGLSVRCIKNNQ